MVAPPVAQLIVTGVILLNKPPLTENVGAEQVGVSHCANVVAKRNANSNIKAFMMLTFLLISSDIRFVNFLLKLGSVSVHD
jgi:hypothetical protein